MTTKTARPGGVRGQRALPRTAAAGSAHACHIGARNEPGTPSQSVVASTTADGGARIALHPVPSATPPQRQRGGPACLGGEHTCMRARTQVAQRKHKKKRVYRCPTPAGRSATEACRSPRWELSCGDGRHALKDNPHNQVGQSPTMNYSLILTIFGNPVTYTVYFTHLAHAKHTAARRETAETPLLLW